MAPTEAERAALVKDGFSWPALFVPLLWILWHRLWLTLVWYIVFALALAWVGRLTDERNATILAVLGWILFALEANNIRRWSLVRRGWRELGSVSGRTLGEAEVRYFQDWASVQGSAAAASAAPTRPPLAPSRHRDDDGPVLGLFAEPGG
jgi:hypothetical protein